MKHLEISEDLHDLISFYCFVNKVSIKDFVNSKLKTLQELKRFSKEKERLKNISS